MKHRVSLHTRLVISHLLVSLISIFLLSAFAASSILRSAHTEIEQKLEDLAFTVSNSLENSLIAYSEGTAGAEQLDNDLAYMLANHPEVRYALFLPDGTPLIVAYPGSLQNPESLWVSLQNEGSGANKTYTDEQGVQTINVAVLVEREEKVYGLLGLGMELVPALEPARRSLIVLALVAMLVTLAVGAFAWLLASNVTNPILNLIQTAENLASGDLSARADPTGPQELHRLAFAVNVMAARLQNHVDELRAFVANASHELRTPITVVKLRSEALRDGALSDPDVAEQFLIEIDDEVDRLGRIVNDLLDLSRMESGLSYGTRTPTNLGILATEVFETFRIRSERAGIELEKHIEPDLALINGNEDQLRRLLYNLLDNAIKYTPSGGKVELRVAPDPYKSTVRIQVKDTGPGIPLVHLSHIFERFYRVDATRPRFNSAKGSGLGLAIAKSIVENNGGKIGVSSQPGCGSVFWAEFPTVS